MATRVKTAADRAGRLLFSPHPYLHAGQRADTRRPAIASYIGPAACQPCHEDKYEGFIQTAHNLTSRPADAQSIAGDFAPEAALMWTRNRNL